MTSGLPWAAISRWNPSGKVRLFFFFQAEDGIRDYKVTGVQTSSDLTSDSAGLRRRLEPGSRCVHRRPSERAGGARPGVSGTVIASNPGNVPSAVVAFDAANAGRR